MKVRRIKKQLIGIVLGAFFTGGIIGWAISPTSHEKEEMEAHEHVEGTTFTCSMHPQIRQEEPGDCPICGMELVPLEGMEKKGSALDPYVLTMTPEAIALANISTTAVVSGEKGAEISLDGKIAADERKATSIPANFGGRVEELYVAFTGQEVRKGQKLAKIYSPELISAHRELIEATKTKSISPALYQAARQKLKQWQLSEAQISQMEQQTDYQEYFDIYAQTAGVVSKKNVAVGDYVDRGQVLFEVTDLAHLWVLMDAYESQVASIAVGDKVKFTVASHPHTEFEAKVSFVDPVLTEGARTIKIRAEVNNAKGSLKPGMLVRANLDVRQTSQTDGGVLVPSSAILWTGKRSVVYREVGSDMNPAFEMVQVDLGPTSGPSQWVTSGLQAGDRVVTKGVFAVDAAAQLSGKYSMMDHPDQRFLEVGAAFDAGVEELLALYLSLKNKLVADEPAEKQGQEIAEKLKGMETKRLTGEALERWNAIQIVISAAAKEISLSEDLTQQRQSFVQLSNGFIELVETFRASRQIYKSYCPMAENDQGAYWLSEFKEIKNPYFGSGMLTCGEVKSILEPTLSSAKPISNQVHQH